MLPAQPNKSVMNGLECLQALVSSNTPLGVRELGRVLDMEPSKVNRILKTYAHMGLIIQDAQNRYQPGPGIHVLAAQSLQGSGLLKAALPSIRKLRKEKLSVALGVLWQDNVCYLYHGRPGVPLEDGVGGTGELYPAGMSSIGLSIIALSGGRKTLPPSMKGYTRSTMQAIRKNGYAVVVQPDGVISMGTSIGKPAFAGLAFAGNISEDRIQVLAETLMNAAQAVYDELSKYHSR